MNISISKTSDIIIEVLRLSSSELNVSHIALLAYLNKSRRFCSAVELASGCGLNIRQLERTTYGTVIEVLERKGLVSVVPCTGTVKNFYAITQLGISELENICLPVRDFLVDLLN